MNVKSEVELAIRRIRPYVRETFLQHSPPLSHVSGVQIFFKLENLQFTGSFKVRGATNKLLTLSPSEREKGIVTASSGNHGAAVAYALKQFQMKGMVFVPENASKAKISNIKRYGITPEFYGTDTGQTEMHAEAYAKKNGMTYVSPYNDPYVIGGQGTIAVELLKQLDSIDAIFVPLGGGGLISGIAGYVKGVKPEIRIIGCSPENSPVMIESVKAGKIIEMVSEPSLSDGTGGGLEPNSITFSLCQKFVDDYITVTEEEIKNVMRQFIENERLLVEGSGVVSLAALLKVREKYAGKNVVLIVSGGNVSLETLRTVLHQGY